MKKYEVWMEGFHVSGNWSQAQFKGRFLGNTFTDACLRWGRTLPTSDQRFLSGNVFWGCRLFDNEKDARKSFG